MKKSLKAAITDNLSTALVSPAAAFISAATPPAPAKKPKAAQVTVEGIPEGMRLVAEPKSRRVHLLMRPTAYGWLERKSQAEGISVNEAINIIIEDAKRREEQK